MWEKNFYYDGTLPVSCSICWPLQYLPPVHSVKHQVIICAWIVTKLKAICLLRIEGIKRKTRRYIQKEPPWPTVLGATFARTTGIVLIVVLIIITVTSCCLFCREGKHADHLNSSNKKARKIIVIHRLQTSLPLLLLLVTAVGRHPDNTILHLAAFLVLLFALCFNPVVYGQLNKELQTKLFSRQRLGVLTTLRTVMT